MANIVQRDPYRFQTISHLLGPAYLPCAAAARAMLDKAAKQASLEILLLDPQNL